MDRQTWSAPTALKKAQVHPLFSVFSASPIHFTGYQWPPDTLQSPLSLWATEVTSLLVWPFHGTELLSRDCPRIRGTSVQVRHWVRPVALAFFLRVYFTLHYQCRTRASICSQGAREECWFPLLQPHGPSFVELWTFLFGDQCPLLLFYCP